jgi:ferredoxin
MKSNHLKKVMRCQMTVKMVRKVVKIDEEKCNGCGLCVPFCAEGALRIIYDKARLVSEQYCDGLGACLGECPQGAITVEERAAEEFDEVEAKHHQEHAEDEHSCPN